MNTREIAEEIARGIENADLLVTDEDIIEMVLDRHLEGMAVVPREPTVAMVEAGYEIKDSGYDGVSEIYKAMIAAEKS